MKTIDLHALTKHSLSQEQAREQLRKNLKMGFSWSRLNPDLLKGAELLPCFSVKNPPSSGAELVPFPVPASRFVKLGAEPWDALAEEKMRWCYPQGKAGPAVARRVRTGLQYYDPGHPTKGTKYYWIGLNTQVAPYRPLLRTLLPALDNFASKDPVPPRPPTDKPGEAWYTSQADDYGVTLYLSAQAESQDKLLLAVALHRKDYFWLGNYLLDPDRYTFIRQQLVYLVGTRLEPWTGKATGRGFYRGMVYRKPQKNKKRPG